MKINLEKERETLIGVARTSLRTKVHPSLADLLTEVSLFFQQSNGGFVTYFSHVGLQPPTCTPLQCRPTRPTCIFINIKVRLQNLPAKHIL